MACLALSLSTGPITMTLRQPLVCGTMLEVQNTFIDYFNAGMNPAAAMKIHRDWLEMGATFCEQDLVDASKNPPPRSVYEWHDQWRKLNLGNYLPSCIINNLSVFYCS